MRRPLEGERQDGSASIEATIVLVIFIFVVMGIYCLVNFCILQAKVTYAVETTAKEISQYTYAYHRFGIDSFQRDMAEQAELAADTYSTLTTFLQSTSDEANLVQQDGVGTYLEGALSGERSDDLSEIKSQFNDVRGVFSSMADDPSSYLKSFAALAGKESTDTALRALAVVLAEQLTQKHFGDDEASADAYLMNKGVEAGYEGLDFSLSKMFQGGDNTIEIVVCYKMSLTSIIPKLDQEVNICQKAITTGWWGDI